MFAAVAGEGTSPILTWEHSEFGWYDAGTCLERLRFRGLGSGLTAEREAITEAREPAPELRLF